MTIFAQQLKWRVHGGGVGLPGWMRGRSDWGGVPADFLLTLRIVAIAAAPLQSLPTVILNVCIRTLLVVIYSTAKPFRPEVLVRCNYQLTAVLALLFPISLLQAEAVTYALTDLGPADEFNQGRVNNQGQVIFSSGGSSFLYNGTRQPIPPPPGATFTANGLNNLGQVVGQVNYPSFTYAVGVYAGGAVQVINSGESRTGYAINDAGQIAGTLVNSYRAFLYADGTFMTINPLPGDSVVSPRGINQTGDVLVISAANADHAAIYSQGVLSIVPGSEGLDIQPSGINNAGQVVGYARDNNHRLPEAVLLSKGQATFLGAPAGGESFANAINDSGVIVGDTLSAGFLATVYDPGTGWVDLNTVLTNGGGWTLEFARSINNQGQIAGTGRHNGVPSAYLLTPVPEPSTLTLFGVALLGVGAYLRRHPSVFR